MQVAHQQQPQQWTETAYDWWQRSKRARALSSAAPPTDPTSAAWAFLRPRGGGSSTTGIAFVDAALRRWNTVPSSSSSSSSLPVIDIRGSTGKTWTIVSLAARFVVATRPSQFTTASNASHHEIDTGSSSAVLPQVIILDSKYDVTTPKLAYAVRSMLLRKLSSSASHDDANLSMDYHQNDPAIVFERDMKDCLSRIHVGTVDDITGWVPLLECIRQQLTTTAAGGTDADRPPTLLLWDGFLSDDDEYNSPQTAARMEVLRQLERLLLDEACPGVFCVTTTANQYRPREYERLVTHRIRLEHTTMTSTTNSHGSSQEYVATVHGVQIPFSISMAGILS